MDEDHLVAAARTLIRPASPATFSHREKGNPGPRGSSNARENWRWSSVSAHLERRDDRLVTVAPLIEWSAGRLADWIETPAAPEALSALGRGRNDRPTVRLSRLPRPARPRDQPRPPAEAAGGEAEGNGVEQSVRGIRNSTGIPSSSRSAAVLRFPFVVGLYQDWYKARMAGRALKPMVFLGDALDRLRAFPEGARKEAGVQLHKVQQGLAPSDWKPMRTVGPGVVEIRIRDEAGAPFV